MDFQWLWYRTKKKVKKVFKKIRRFFKRYIRLLVRHTKAGDYSVLLYTILSVVAFILVITLFGKIFSAIGEDKDNKKAPTTEQVATPIQPVEDPAITAKKQLAEQCRVIYKNNKDYLLLINEDNPVPSDYTFEHHTLNCGYDVDKRMHTDLINMLEACNNAGHEYSIISGYRSYDTQQSIIDDTISTYIEQGMTQEEAEAKTYISVQKAGASEHQTGLAIDISSYGVTSLEDYLAEEPTNQWLMSNSYKYGFILRYPQDKLEITKISFEPWHFRYVGIETATFLYNNKLTLEEFHELINYY